MIFLMLCIDCVLRYSGRSSIAGSHELVGILIVYVYLFGIVEVYRNQEDISLTFLSDRFPPALRKIHGIFVSAVIVITMILLSYAAFARTMRGLTSYTSQLGYPVALYYFPLGVAGAIVAVTVTLEAFRTYSGRAAGQLLTNGNLEHKGE